MLRRSVASRLPDFPWDSLNEAKRRAAAHPGGIVDLSVGTPVDPVAINIQAALSSVADVPGYPVTHGTPQLRAAAVAAMARRFGVTGISPNAVLPVIGTKELIASITRDLGFGSGDLVVFPELAYPTYEISALLAGSKMQRSDTIVGGATPSLVFLNSPSNPTGRVIGVEELRDLVAVARSAGAIVVSDECYLGLGWDAKPVSVLDERVCGGDFTGLLAVHSLSKTSNLASYRTGFITGDHNLVAELLEVRRHAGMMMPYPIQAAMVEALTDDSHENAQREIYRSRRAVLQAGLRGAEFEIEHSEAGLYIWATRGESCWDTVNWFADRGILVAPGEFYGPRGAQFVRCALTATDERITAAVTRIV